VMGQFRLELLHQFHEGLICRHHLSSRL
jgi:hypothetical protein